MKLTHIALLVLTFHCAAALTTGEELDCLTDSERKTARLYPHLQQQAYAALAKRSKDYEQVQTPEQIREWQRARRQFMIDRLGGFPERSPLNAQTVGVIEADGYRIEKVIYDSRPQHRITANLYLPESTKPVPGVVVSSVEPGSPAAQVDLQPGHLVLSVNRVPVNSVADFQKALGKSEKTRRVLLRVGNQRFSWFVLLKLD